MNIRLIQYKNEESLRVKYIFDIFRIKLCKRNTILNVSIYAVQRTNYIVRDITVKVLIPLHNKIERTKSNILKIFVSTVYSCGTDL